VTEDAYALELLRAIAADLRAVRVAIEREQVRLFDPEAIIAPLRAIAERTRGLRAAVDPYAAEIAELLRVIAGIFGDDCFTAAELIARVQPLWPWNNPRKVGKLFARIDGRNFGGLCVQQLGAERAGAIWRVCRN
jgi:hypothetical protein